MRTHAVGAPPLRAGPDDPADLLDFEPSGLWFHDDPDDDESDDDDTAEIVVPVFVPDDVRLDPYPPGWLTLQQHDVIDAFAEGGTMRLSIDYRGPQLWVSGLAPVHLTHIARAMGWPEDLETYRTVIDPGLWIDLDHPALTGA